MGKIFQLLAIAIIVNLDGLYSQELVINGGFEDHGEIYSIGYNNWAACPNWNNVGFLSQIFDRNYKFSEDEIRKGYVLKEYLPYAGNSCVCVPAHLYRKRSQSMEKGGGGGGYIITKLLQNLKPGSKYSVEFSVKIRNNFNAPEQYNYDFLKNFGIILTQEAPKVSKSQPYPDLLFSNYVLGLDTIVFDIWNKVEFLIQPTVDLEFATIGWFNSLEFPIEIPIEFGPVRYEFLVDGVSVKIISDAEANAMAYPDGKKLIKLVATEVNTEEDKVIEINFNYNRSIPDSAECNKIYKFAEIYKKFWNNKIISISGYSDSIGGEEYNYKLGYRRAQKIRNILVDQCEIDPSRIVIKSFGELKSNTRNERYSEIEVTEKLISNSIYAEATKAALSGDIDSAFCLILELVGRGDLDLVLLIFDTDLEKLHVDSRWKGVEFFIEKSYSKYSKPKLAFFLDKLYCRDQMIRGLRSEYQTAKGSIPRDWKFIGEVIDHDQAEMLSDSDLLDLKEILVTNGWPTTNEVGTRANTVPALVSLHSKNINLKIEYLPLIENAWKDEIISSKWYACMVDKILLEKGELQKYGTQYCKSEEYDVLQICPVEDIHKAALDRESIGLPAINFSNELNIGIK